MASGLPVIHLRTWSMVALRELEPICVPIQSRSRASYSPIRVTVDSGVVFFGMSAPHPVKKGVKLGVPRAEVGEDEEVNLKVKHVTFLLEWGGLPRVPHL